MWLVLFIVLLIASVVYFSATKSGYRYLPLFGQYPQHPVLRYQYGEASRAGVYPASYGDAIRPYGEVVKTGPLSGYPQRGDTSRDTYNTSGFQRAYSRGDGPYPGLMMNVPVPAGSLKLSSEYYKYPFYYQQKPLAPYDYFKPYGPNQASLQNDIVVADTPFYKRDPVYSPGVYSGIPGTVPFISSVSSYAPFPEVQTAWEKTGMLQTLDPSDNTVLNLYRRSVAPLQDLFEYSVQDKDGFITPLRGVNYLEDGDIVPTVEGKESLGKWKANIYVNNKYVWA